MGYKYGYYKLLSIPNSQGKFQGNFNSTFSFKIKYSVTERIRGKEGEIMVKENKVTSSDLAGIYKDIADIIGIEAVTLLHNNFQGQQVTFPKKLYNKSYILSQLEVNTDIVNIKSIAIKYGYTERRLKQLLKERMNEYSGKT